MNEKKNNKKKKSKERQKTMTNQNERQADDLWSGMNNLGLGRTTSTSPTNLKKYITMKQSSFTETEKVVLKSLLIEEEKKKLNDEQSKRRDTIALKKYLYQDHNVDWDLMESLLDDDQKKVLTDDMLFSIPVFEILTPKRENSSIDEENELMVPLLVPPRTKRNTSNHIGLWRAHEEGIKPSLLKSHSKSNHALDTQTAPQINGQNHDEDSIRSDEEVRHPTNKKSKDTNQDDDQSNTTASSWDLSDGGFDHYDTWGVLKDEYAQEFGFDYSERNHNQNVVGSLDDNDDDDDDDVVTSFRILGTSADDLSAQPHVLSPPLMESLLSFLPETLSSGQNFWLKFSLVRDGSSIETLLRYVRAAPNTILAIETTDGNVFGSFTTSAWSNRARHHGGFYGSQQAFLWKMRHNRLTTPCYSLFDQAQLESEIDVFMCSGINDYVQFCGNDRIILGSGKLKKQSVSTSTIEEDDGRSQSIHLYEDENEESDAEDYGFGLAINGDLLHGTSSPCATFRNPSLCRDHNHSKDNDKEGGEIFDIVNLEVWTFTPCRTIPDAERLEMTKYFIEESVMSLASTRSSNTQSSRRGGYWATNPNSNRSACSSTWNASDFSQREFYRRVGENDENEIDREGWSHSINRR